MQLSIDTWNGNNINDGVLYQAYFPEGTVLLHADAKPGLVERTHFSPVFTYVGRSEVLLPLKIKLLGTIAEQIDTIKKWFDPFDDSGLKTLVVHDAIGYNRQWFIQAQPISIPAIDGNVVTVNLLVPDPIWQASIDNTVTWSITTTGSTQVVNAGGNQDSYPVYSLSPTSAKTTAGTVRYRNFSVVYNQTARRFSNYPLDLGEDAWDTAALVAASKMQADGSDIHVFVDGAETDYWLDGANTTNTKLWINVDLQPQVALTVSGAHSTTVETLTIANTTGNKDALSRLPNDGILLTPSNELIHFTEKNEGGLTLTCKRGCYDSTAASIADAGTLYFVDHEIYVVYGDTSLTNYTVDNTKKPILTLSSSTNNSWDWDSFTVYNASGAASQRTARWAGSISKLSDVAQFTTSYWYSWIYYTGMSTSAPVNQSDPAAQEFTVMGLFNSFANESGIDSGQWGIYIPSGVSTVSWDGNKYNGAAFWWWDGAVDLDYSSDGVTWTTVDTITTPSTASTVIAWSTASLGLGATYQYMRVRVNGTMTSNITREARFEVDNATFTLDSAAIPYVAFIGEAQPYLFDATLTNSTTGDYLTITYPIPLNDTLEIDTDARTITHLEWGVEASGGVVEDSIRWDMLKLQNGGNTFTYTEAGVQAVTNTITWTDRNS